MVEPAGDEEEAAPDGGGAVRGMRGVIVRVIAWTLDVVSGGHCNEAVWKRRVPVKCAGEDQVVVGGHLQQAGLELALVDQAAGFVDDD